MKAAIFSNADELNILLQRDDINEYHLIALTPAADYAAEKKRITYSLIEDYISCEHIFKEQANNFDKIEEVIDSLARKNKSIICDIINTGAIFHSIKTFYDRYYLSSIILNSLLEKHETLIFFHESRKDSIMAPENINILSIIIEVYRKQLFNKNTFISLHCLKPQVLTEYKSLCGVLKKTCGVFLAALRHFKSCKKATILINPRFDYYVLENIKKNFYFILYPNRKLKIKKPNFSADVIAEYHEILSKKLKLETYLQELMIPQIISLLESLHNEYLAYVNYWINKLKKISPKFIVSLTPSSQEEIGITIAAKKLGIHQIIAQHGGFIGYVDFKMLDYLEKKHADTIVTYGDGCVQAYHPAPTFQVGSLSCYKIYKKREMAESQRDEKRKILFISDGLQGSVFYSSNHIKPGIETARIQRNIIEIIKSYGEIFLKLYPFEQQVNPVYEWIEDNNFSNITNLNPKKLEDVFLEKDFDLIVTDAPATTLLLAVSTNIPVIAFYDKRYYKFTEDGKELLKKRVMLYETYEEFQSGLLEYLKQPIKKEIIVNDEFLFSYGLVSKEKSPLENWNDFLKEKLTKGNSL